MQFVIAETLHRTGGSAAEIETAYLNGIKASFEEVGATTADYEAYVAQASVNPGAGNMYLEEHIQLKNISDCLLTLRFLTTLEETRFQN